MREVSLIQGCLLRAFSKSQLVCWSTLLGSGKLGYTACEASSFKYPGQEAYSVKYLTTILRRYIIGSVCNAESRATCTRRWNIGYQYMLVLTNSNSSTNYWKLLELDTNYTWNLNACVHVCEITMTWNTHFCHPSAVSITKRVRNAAP